MMGLMFDAFLRALFYSLLPRVMWLSLLPLLVGVGLTLTGVWLVWDVAVDQVRWWLESFAYLQTVWDWLDGAGFSRFKAVLAPLLVVLALTPVLLLLALIAVAQLMTPALVRLVVARRFEALQEAGAGNWLAGMVWALGSTGLALLALLVSMPLWAIPPLWMILPPLIWGWLTYRVLAFDALARHASEQERALIFHQHRGVLLLMGLCCGYLSTVPSLILAAGSGFAPAFVLLAPLVVWLYVHLFAFSSLWFIHFCLSALERLRASCNNPLPPIMEP